MFRTEFDHPLRTYGAFSDPQEAAKLVSLSDRLATVPPAGIVIDIGSGAAFSLEAMIHATRPDICTIGLDPGYFADQISHSQREDIDQISSFFTPEEQRRLAEDKSWCHRLVAGIAESLPFMTESADMVISFAAIPQYAMDTQRSFNELTRVLKPGALAILGPMREWVFADWDEVVKNGASNGQISSYDHFTRVIEATRGQFVDASFTELVK